MGTSLSNLVANLTEGISKIRCKDYDFYLNMKVSKISLIKYKYLSWNKNYSNKIHEELKKRLKNTFKSSYDDINKFILL